MSEVITVTKSSGQSEPFSEEKVNRVVSWACENVDGVSASQVAMKAQLSLYPGVPTREIHETIVKSAADLISESTPNYDVVAARLNIFRIRKAAFGQYDYPDFYSHIEKMVSAKRYDADLLKLYSKDEIDELGEYIQPDRDNNFRYSATVQLDRKYLVQDRVNGKLFEGPQHIFMLVPMCLFQDYPVTTRLSYIKRFYDAASNFKISLPTPIMAGVRTPTRQFSSCVVIEAGDSLDSINASASAIVRYVSQRAGIGIGAGRIRALGSSIRGGEAYHTGCIPFYKHFQTAVKSCSQGGVRGGAATLYYPLWHLEVESLLVLKNNRGVEENRVRHLDYGVLFNKTMYERLIKGGNITLFSPHDVKDLYDAFFEDQDKFAELYTKYEADESIRKKQVPAIELFSAFAQERAGTGRIYLANVDHINQHGPFDEKVAPVRQSNLCLEIALPTKPLEDINDADGEIALCTLSAFNLGAIGSLSELGELSELLVRALDALLDYQNYPVKAAYLSTMKRRSLGIGVTNYAYYLAKHGVRYSDGSANYLTHKAFEAIQFYLLKASMELAKERGACDGFHETKYAKGILTIDTYKRDLDAVANFDLIMDWDWLREQIKKHGLRNSTVTALMPCETSSQITNSTNGIEPPRGFISVKSSKDGVLKQVVPEFERLRDQYELLWSIPDNQGYLTLVAIMQKFVDQAISANTNYDPAKFPGGKVPVKTILGDILNAYKLGVKTLYYHNTRDGAGVEAEDESCSSGACKL